MLQEHFFFYILFAIRNEEKIETRRWNGKVQLLFFFFFFRVYVYTHTHLFLLLPFFYILAV